MSDQSTLSFPVFKPLPEHDTLNVLMLLARISERVLVDGECWLWTGALTKDGYGHLSTGGSRLERAHRTVYRLCVGAIPSGVEVCHNCPGGDRPACINPAHLFLGTHTENMRDCARKGRIKSRDSRGEKNPAVKLADHQIVYVRKMFPTLPKGKAADILAAELGVSKATIYRIAKGDIWRHVG